MTRRRIVVLAVALVTIALTPEVRAHDVGVTNIARVFVDQTEPHRYVLTVADDAGAPSLVGAAGLLPSSCHRVAPSPDHDRQTRRVEFQCERELTVDHALMFPWKLAGVVVIANWRDGERASAYFAGTGLVVPVRLSELRAAAGSRLHLVRRYFVLGGEHILLGIDHLLFVLGLVLLVRGIGSLVKTITAFTIAHSLTLGAAVLDFVTVDNQAVEATIALSIVLLAREIVTGARGERHLVHRKPWLIAFVFGLLHGFGFAGALGEIGLRATDIPFALVFFNLGVEAGQLAFVGVLLAVHAALRSRRRAAIGWLQPRLGYALGIVATFWFFDRL